MTQGTNSGALYNYDHFGFDHRELDLLGGVRVGEPAPDFTATKLDGTSVALSDFRGRPVVLEAGSATCPMFVSKIDSMSTLTSRYPDVAFLVLYVREAHPGQHIGAHRDAGEKAAGARIVADDEHDDRTILIDDLAGTAHASYGAMPNTVHVIDTEGVVAFRAMWNDPAAVDAALQKVLNGQDAETVSTRFRPAGPVTMLRVLRRAGRRAVWDFVIAFPALVRAHLRPGHPGEAA